MGPSMDLFGELAPPPVAPAPTPPAVAALGDRLPPGVLLGTSSWSFPGWRGLVWAGQPDTDLLAREGLRAWSSHPLLRLVGVDRSFYAPVPAAHWQRYHAQAVPGTGFLVKAPASACWAVFPQHGSYGERAGQQNPDFLSPDLIWSQALEPMLTHLPGRPLCLVVQLPPQPLHALGGPDGFVDRVRHLCSTLAARSIQNSHSHAIVAIEPRTPQALTPAYARALADTGARHCVAVHPTMPSVDVQAARVLQHLPPGPFVARWMLGVPMSYSRAKARYAPFHQLVDPAPPVRRALARHIARAVQDGHPALVTVNNKAEGCAPLSVVGLAEQVVARL